MTGWGDISTWIPTKILLSGPTQSSSPPDAIIDLRVDLVDEFGYTIFKTEQTVEFSADTASAVFSVDQVNWSNPLQVDINLGTAKIWFKSPVEGEITISVTDVDSEPTMQAADDLTILIERPVVKSGNYALSFDADDDYVSCGNDTSLQITGKEITLEAWIYAKNWKDEVWQGCIINKEQNGSGTDNGYMLRAGKNGTLNFNLGNGSWNEINSSAGAMQKNTWYHVAGTYDGSRMRAYINGEQIANSAKIISIKNALNVDLFIGDSQKNPKRVFNGMIDEVRIWKVARTQKQLISTMHDTLDQVYYNTNDSGLVAYWKFNENEGQYSTDFSTNTNNARLGSSADVDINDPFWVESGSLVSVSDNEYEISNDFTLSQNYPNPFNNETVFHVSLNKVAKVHAVIFNSNGELVRHIVNGQLPKGLHSLRWDSKNNKGEVTASGIYFLSVRFTDSSGESFIKSRKLVFLK